MLIESNDFREWVRAKARATGAIAMKVLEALSEAVVEYQNTPVPCDACREMHPRKDLARLGEVPACAETFYRFCDACQKRLRLQYRYQGYLDAENRKVLAQLRRAMDNDLPATLTLRQWIATLKYYEGRCAYCQVRPYQAIEHFIPIHQGGGTTADNCVPACKSCNSAKGARHPDEIGESSRSPAAIARVRGYLLTQQPVLPVLEPAEGCQQVEAEPLAGQ